MFVINIVGSLIWFVFVIAFCFFSADAIDALKESCRIIDDEFGCMKGQCEHCHIGKVFLKWKIHHTPCRKK